MLQKKTKPQFIFVLGGPGAGDYFQFFKLLIRQRNLMRNYDRKIQV